MVTWVANTEIANTEIAQQDKGAKTSQRGQLSGCENRSASRSEYGQHRIASNCQTEICKGVSSRVEMNTPCWQSERKLKGKACYRWMCMGMDSTIGNENFRITIKITA